MPSVTYQVGASSDDAFTDDYGQDCYKTDTTLKIGYFGVYRTYTGFRFQNVGLGSKHKIVTAYLQLKASETLSESIHAHIYCEDVDNASNFDTVCTTMDTRTTTTAYTDWTSMSGSSGSWIDSPDFADAIQEVLDRGGWSAGNALNVLVFQQDYSGGVGTFYTYDNASADAAKLVITYRYKGFAGAMV